MYKIKRALFFFFVLRKRVIYVGIIAVAIATIATVITTPIISRHWHNRLTRADFLYDFDYMIAALEANFPSFGIIYRQHGVDMLEAAHDLRNRLEHRSTRINFELFWNMLRDDFFNHALPGDEPLPIGHLRLVADAERRWLLSVYETFSYFGAHSYFVDILGSPPTHSSYPTLRAHVHTLVRSPCWQPYRVLSTNIIEEGSIGYLRIYTFSREPASYELEMLTVLYSEIADFEHLIIDIRGNTGGDTHIFERNVTGFLTNSPFRTHFHHFIMNGEHNMSFAQATREIRRITRNAIYDIYVFEGEGFRFIRGNLYVGNNVSCCVLDDISRMNYVFVESRIIMPQVERYRSSFDGEIWLLIDRHVYSAALYVAAVHKEIGFATLVGETTGGGAASPWHSNFIVLPNTGIIVRYDPTFVTDRHGRPLEYGIEPHYFNRPGMDALETVLAMIAEGALK